MKIAILSDPNSSHTQKWVTALASRGVEIALIGLADNKIEAYSNYNNIQVYSLGLNENIIKQSDSTFSKLIYILVIRRLKLVLKEIKPDMLHAHYASSYGLLGALSFFHPFIISVWGSDVYDFPNRSIIHKNILKFNLKRADILLSTSRAMANEASKYTSKGFEITPFGVDTDMFKPNLEAKLISNNEFTIGIVKSLEKEYGINYLLEAFALLKEQYNKLNLKLLIIGGGSLESELKELAVNLDIDSDCNFVGKISYEQVPEFHCQLDIAVYPSIAESFGVAVLESSACEKPVIVSNVGGLPEVVENGVTGFVVPERSPEEIAKHIAKFIDNRDLITKMGKAGREFVIENYSWNNSVDKMIKIYNNI